MKHGLGVANMAVTYDKATNLRRIGELMAEGADRGTSFIVFPELCISGYPDLSVPITSRASIDQRRRLAQTAESLSGPSVDALTKHCRQARLYIQVGFVERDPTGDHLYNAVALIGPDGPVGHYRKAHNPFEHSYFTQGDHLSVTSLPLGVVGSVICYDVAFPEVPRVLAMRGASVLAMSAAWGAPSDADQDYLIAAMDLASASAAFSNHVWLLLANQCTGSPRSAKGGVIGRSQIIGPDGLCQCILHDEEGVLVLEADIADSVQASKFGRFYGQNMLRDRRPELYADVLMNQRAVVAD